jgi:hypothetical protein
MEHIKEKLIQTAKDKFKDVKPCGEHKSLYDCFTVQNDRLLLWFNTLDGTTKVLQHNLMDEVHECA